MCIHSALYTLHTHNDTITTRRRRRRRPRRRPRPRYFATPRKRHSHRCRFDYSLHGLTHSRLNRYKAVGRKYTTTSRTLPLLVLHHSNPHLTIPPLRRSRPPCRPSSATRTRRPSSASSPNRSTRSRLSLSHDSMSPIQIHQNGHTVGCKEPSCWPTTLSETRTG